jgi:hypothetical protein
VYARLPDDSSPALHRVEVGRRNTGIATRGLGRLTLQHAHVTGAITANTLNGLTGQLPGSGLLTVEDSFVGYSSRMGQGLGSTGQWTETIATRVKARRIGNDGFNFHATAGLSPRAVLNDCDGSFSGHIAGDSAQGASNHEQTVMIINGGRFDRNVSGGMVVIDDAVCDIHGDTSYGPVSMARNMRLGNTVGTIASQAGCAWLDNSTGTVTGTVEVTDGLGRGVRTEAAGAVRGVEAILSARNAVLDALAYLRDVPGRCNWSGLPRAPDWEAQPSATAQPTSDILKAWSTTRNRSRSRLSGLSTPRLCRLWLTRSSSSTPCLTVQDVPTARM